MHETAYENNLKKIKHASGKLAEVRERIQKYDAELKMSAAEAEVAALAETFNLNITTDFGQLEQVIQGKIDKNRGKARVAADLSTEGLADIEAEERMQKSMAEEALTQFEVGARVAVAGNHEDCAKPRRIWGRRSPRLRPRRPHKRRCGTAAHVSRIRGG